MKNKIFVILFGILAIGVGIFLLVSGNNKAKRCTSEAVGTVNEIIEEKEETTDEDGAIVSDTYTYTYFPVIEYKAGDKTVNKRSETGYGSKDKYKVGDNIDILYDPNNPEEYIIKNDKSSNIIGIVFIAAGVIVTGIGIIKNFN